MMKIKNKDTQSYKKKQMLINDKNNNPMVTPNRNDTNPH